MNIIFALIFYVGTQDGIVDLKVLETFPNMQACEEKIMQVKPEFRPRVRCFAMHSKEESPEVKPEPVKDSVELAPNEPCIIKRGFATGKPCHKA